jgi:hypothetical protein
MNKFIKDPIDIESVISDPDIALISDKTESRAELVRSFGKYLKLTRRDKRFSDYYSEQIYGCTVPSMFFALNESFKVDVKSLIKSDDTILVSEPDIYYNKDAFDSGKINLCFVIGYSGSGKSVLTREYIGSDIERVELDDIVCVKDHYSLEGLRRESMMLYSFFTGAGSKYYISRRERDLFEEHDKVFVDFIEYACEYAASHKDRKFILEGIWTYLFFGDPSLFDDYAVFIKGTSLIKSKLRRLRRESSGGVGGTWNRILEFGIYMTDSLLYDSNVDKWRHHFEKKTDVVFKTEESRISILRESVMNQMSVINSCFVHGDDEGIRNLMESVSSEDSPQARFVIDECKRALEDLKQV